MRKNDKGYTLIELIVVIAILAVMIGIGILSISLLLGTQAKGCAQKVSGQLNETKTGCLSRFNETMTLQYRTKGSDPAIESDGYYTENFVYSIDKDANKYALTNSEIRKMGSKNVVITVFLSDGSSFELGTTRSVTISFNRSNGAFEKVIVDGTQTNHYIEKMTFSSGAHTYTISMVTETGKHTLS